MQERGTYSNLKTATQRLKIELLVQDAQAQFKRFLAAGSRTQCTSLPIGNSAVEM